MRHHNDIHMHIDVQGMSTVHDKRACNHYYKACFTTVVTNLSSQQGVKERNYSLPTISELWSKPTIFCTKYCVGLHAVTESRGQIMSPTTFTILRKVNTVTLVIGMGECSIEGVY